MAVKPSSTLSQTCCLATPLAAAGSSWWTFQTLLIPSMEAMFREFRQHAPSLSPWIESCYSGQPNLLLGEHSIRSCCGVQQGDPLGPLGFALVLQPVIERIKEKVAGLSLNAWYLDDGTIVGTPEQLQAALLIIEEEGKRVGLHLNRSKSLLYVPDTCHYFTPTA